MRFAEVIRLSVDRELQVESRLDQEESRALHFLSSQTSQPLRRILEDKLISPHLSTIIAMPNSGLDVMIDLDKFDDLARLYRLFSMVPAGVPTLRKALRETVIRRGRDINSASASMEGDDPQDEEMAEKISKAKGKGKARANAGSQVLSLALKWVQDVLDMKDKFDSIWADALKNDREIESSVNEVCALRADP